MKTIKFVKSALLGAALSVASSLALAEVAVIVNPANSATISTDDISALYLGKTKKFSDGSAAVPLDRKEGDALRTRFLDGAVGKSESQMKSYWSRLIFTGKGVPPEMLDSDKEVKAQVAANKDRIGYIDSSSVDESVKVIATF